MRRSGPQARSGRVRERHPTRVCPVTRRPATLSLAWSRSSTSSFGRMAIARTDQRPSVLRPRSVSPLGRTGRTSLPGSRRVGSTARSGCPASSHLRCRPGRPLFRVTTAGDQQFIGALRRCRRRRNDGAGKSRRVAQHVRSAPARSRRDLPRTGQWAETRGSVELSPPCGPMAQGTARPRRRSSNDLRVLDGRALGHASVRNGGRLRWPADRIRGSDHGARYRQATRRPGSRSATRPS